MIDIGENQPRGARGNVRLQYNGREYWFATQQEAELALKLLVQADQVITVKDGVSPSA